MGWAIGGGGEASEVHGGLGDEPWHSPSNTTLSSTALRSRAALDLHTGSQAIFHMVTCPHMIWKISLTKHLIPPGWRALPTWRPQSLKSMVDILPASQSELFLLTKFDPLFVQQTSKVLFNPVTCALWSHLEVWMLYSKLAPWNVIYPAWEVKARAKAGDQLVKFSVLKGAHHFVCLFLLLLRH